MRYELIRYWQPNTPSDIWFALRGFHGEARPIGSLVTGKDGNPTKPFLFLNAQEALTWARNNLTDFSIEWSGTTW